MMVGESDKINEDNGGDKSSVENEVDLISFHDELRLQRKKIEEVIKEKSLVDNNVAAALNNLAESLCRLDKKEEKPESSISHVKCKELVIPKYAGSHEKKTPFDYLSELERYSLASGLDGRQMFYSIVPLGLTGQAYEWFLFVKDDLECWAEFCVAFRKEFQPPGYENELRRELEERTQGCHESLSHYIRVINGYYERIDPDTPDNVRIARIMRQMHPKYREKLMRSG
jgi:hypothetical protein